MVYTGAANPVWRMLLTSYNSDNSVSKIIELDAATGAMTVYTPQRPMGIEDPVTQAFDNASGTGAALVKARSLSGGRPDPARHLRPSHLDGYLRAARLEPGFVGVGFVDAYQATANNVVFGDSKSAALQSYLAQLATVAPPTGQHPNKAASTRR